MPEEESAGCFVRGDSPQCRVGLGKNRIGLRVMMREREVVKENCGRIIGEDTLFVPGGVNVRWMR